eukprot:PhF_6_TR27208/c0_g1_i5/m.40022
MLLNIVLYLTLLLTISNAVTVNYWPNGIIYYQFSDTVSSEYQPTRSLVLSVMETFTSKTCIRFTPTAFASSLVTFDVSTTPGSCIPTYLGEASSSNTFTTSDCSVGDLVTGFQLLLGMDYELSRPDRNTAIQVYPSLATSTTNFAIQNTRLYYPYDETSLFQSNSFYWSRGEATILGLTSEPLGWRSALSPRDVQRIQFIHNNCSSSTTTITCAVSVPTTATDSRPIVVGYSQGIDIQMVCQPYNSGGTFTNNRCTSPTSCTVVTLAYLYTSGQSQHWQWTPTVTSSGQIILMTLTFKQGSVTVTNDIRFKVLNSPYACFGVGSNDGSVCSGHGTCGSTGCTCSALYTGANCNLTASCPVDVMIDFENRDRLGLLTYYRDAKDIVVNSTAAVGMNSLELKSGDTAFTPFDQGTQLLEWYTYVPDTVNSTSYSGPGASIGIKGYSSTNALIFCFAMVPTGSGRWKFFYPVTSSGSLASFLGTKTSRTNTWIPIRIYTDWTTTFRLYIDGVR